MALASAKQLLDELMGRGRNLNPDDKSNCNGFEEPSICKYFLVNFCPNDLFVNTKADLGPCSKVHDEKVKSEYEKSDKIGKLGYEDDFLRFCQGMLGDVEKRIRRAKQRLALANQEKDAAASPTNGPKTNEEEKMQVLSERISELLEKVEQLGCEGKVEEAQGIMKLCDQLKEERDNIKKASQHWLQQTAEIAAAQEKQMEVCEVCGAFLIVGDAQQRVDDHLMGKQHVGYARLKAAVEDILIKREKDKEEREKLRIKERSERREEDERKKKEVPPKDHFSPSSGKESSSSRNSGRDKSSRHRSRSPRERSRNRSVSRERKSEKRDSRKDDKRGRYSSSGKSSNHDRDRSRKDDKSSRRRSRSRSHSRSSKRSDRGSSRRDEREKKSRRSKSSDDDSSDHKDNDKKGRRGRDRSQSKGHEHSRNGKDDD